MNERDVGYFKQNENFKSTRRKIWHSNMDFGLKTKRFAKSNELHLTKFYKH